MHVHRDDSPVCQHISHDDALLLSKDSKLLICTKLCKNWYYCESTSQIHLIIFAQDMNHRRIRFWDFFMACLMYLIFYINLHLSLLMACFILLFSSGVFMIFTHILVNVYISSSYFLGLMQFLMFVIYY